VRHGGPFDEDLVRLAADPGREEASEEDLDGRKTVRVSSDAALRGPWEARRSAASRAVEERHAVGVASLGRRGA
jgi:hypothetical protein